LSMINNSPRNHKVISWSFFQKPAISIGCSPRTN
jgi:hypothetical protein